MTVADQPTRAGPRRREHRHRPGVTCAGTFDEEHEENLMLIRKLSAAAAALGLVSLAAPPSAAVADPSPATPGPRAVFVPPRVGPIGVAIGPTILGGKVIDPGLNVSLPGISLPPITWTPPS